MEAHLNRYGRGRLITPVYAALANNGSDRQLAEDIFARAKANYHPLAIVWITGLMEAGQPAD
jgi:hypothetical protein